MGKNSAKSPPPAPTAGENYESWIKAYSQYAPERQQAEMGDLATEIALAQKATPAMLALSQQYSPLFNQQAIDLEKQFAGQYNDLAQQQRIAEIQQAAAISPLLRQIEDPTQASIRAMLGKQIETDLAAGSGLTADMQREIEQAVRAGQSARGMTRGNAAVTAEAFSKGSAGQQLAQQRRQAAQQFLQTQATTQTDPLQFVTGRQQTKLTQQMQPQTPQIAGVSSLTPQAMAMNNQAGLQNQMVQYNYNQANQGGGLFGGLLGGGLMGTLGGMALAPAAGGASLLYPLAGGLLGAGSGAASSKGG